MYDPDTVRNYLRERPFRPIRTTASEGPRFDIYHPDQVMPGMREVAIGIPSQEGGAYFSRQIRVAYIHIVAIEELIKEPA